MIHALVFAAAAFVVWLYFAPSITEWPQDQNTKVRRPALAGGEEEAMRDSS